MAKKILIIDDDLDILNTMKEILEKNGFEVDATDDHTIIFDFKKQFDLILVDIKMPKISGYDLIKILREKFEYKPKIYFISITPKIEVDLSEVDGFIQKPFTPESLVNDVKEALADTKST